MAGQGQQGEQNKKRERKHPQPGSRRLSAVEEGYQLLRDGELDSAIQGLEQVLEACQAAAQASAGGRGRSSWDSAQGDYEATMRGSTAGSVLATAEDEEAAEAATRQAAMVIQLLCLCYSRRRDWEAVCKYTSMVLGPGASVPADRKVKTDLQVRRAVALTHLAGPDAGGSDAAASAGSKGAGIGVEAGKSAGAGGPAAAAGKPRAEAGKGGAEAGRRGSAERPKLDLALLERAAADLEEAFVRNSADESVRRCRDVVGFLLAQAKGSGPVPPSAAEEAAEELLRLCAQDSEEEMEELPQPRELRGLERIRAMSP